ncbi:MAG: protein kinase [Planctomycetes bacterium]|nr:protein kinase [Planctomycetota bacterium]
MPREALDRALGEAEARGRPIERHLVETGALGRDAAREVEVARSRLARACAACRKVTYLLPDGSEAGTPCEHCGGALSPPPPSGAHAAPRSGAHAAPASRAQSAPPAPRAGAQSAAPPSGVRPAAPELRPAAPPVAPAPAERPPALLPDDDDDGPPLPSRLGATRIEAVLAQSERVVVYAGRIGETRVAVRALRPERAARRREVDRFFCQAQVAAPCGLEPLDVGTDALGAPFLAIRRPDDVDLGPVLLGLDVLDQPSDMGRISTDTDTGIFERLNRQRQQLLREVQECSRRRDRCVGRYVLLEELERGAGALWRGWDTDQNEVVTVRVLDAARAAPEGRLLRELDEQLVAAERLRHASLLPLRDHGVDGGRLFLVREHLVGAPLHANATLEVVVGQVLQAAQALSYAHGLGCAHGGLHPGNVLVRGDRSVVVVDFGLAAAAAACGEVGIAWRVARAGCAPPEWSADRPDDVAGDLHALGALLFRAAALRLPDEPRPPADGPDAASDVLAIAERCLATDPAERYAGALDLARDLEKVLAGELPAARTPRPAPAAQMTPSSVVGTLSGVFKRWLGR